MNANDFLPLLLLAVAAAPTLFALAGLLFDDRARLSPAAPAWAAMPAGDATASRESVLSRPEASDTVEGSRRREMRAPARRYFPQAAQGSLALAH